MLRITPIQIKGSPVTLKLEGKILSDWVPLLEQECQAWIARECHVVLDLSEVTFVDHLGIELLQRLPSRSLSIVNGSGFIAELVDMGGQS